MIKRRIIFIASSVGLICLIVFIKTKTSGGIRKRNNVDSTSRIEQIVVEPNEYKLYEKDTYSLEMIRKKLGIEKVVKSQEKFSVAIIDSGVYPHNSIIHNRDRIVAFKDFLYEKELPYDDSGHGTAIAGIIAGESEDERNTGLAPYVNIVALKVLDAKDKCKALDVYDAINWTIEHKNEYNIRLINISIGIMANEEERKLLKEICSEALKNGIIIVTSAGNKESLLNRYSLAEFPGVISVGSIETTNDEHFEIAEYSQSWLAEYKNVPDIYALGTNIYAPKSNVFYKGNDGEYIKEMKIFDYFSGTSFSTAVVAGYLCELIKENPNLDNNQVIKKMYENAEEVYDADINISVPALYRQ